MPADDPIGKRTAGLGERVALGVDAMNRYHRQMLLPGIGPEGQRRLGESHAVVVGCGALGCAAADLLARAGVGTLTIIDRDVVEATNLQRQTLFDQGDADAGSPKAEAARARLSRVNPAIRVRGVVADVTHRNAERLVRGTDGAPLAGVIIDGTDNFETRYLLNDLSVKLGLPLCYGGVVGSEGMSATFVPGGACLRCVFEEPPAPGTMPTCDTAGVLGPAAAIVGACQAADAIKLLAGIPERLGGTLLHFDLWTNQRRRVDLAGARRPDCPCCGERSFPFLDGATAQRAVRLCGRNAVQIAPPEDDRAGEIDLERLADRLGPSAAGGRAITNGFLLRAVVPGVGGAALELTVFRDGRAVVRGTEETEVARAAYARYVGH